MKRIIACAICVVIIISAFVGCATSKYTCRLVEEGEKPEIISSNPDGSFVPDKDRDRLIEKEIRAYLKGEEIDSKNFTYDIIYSAQGTYNEEMIMLYWVIITDVTGTEHFKGFIIK